MTQCNSENHDFPTGNYDIVIAYHKCDHSEKKAA